MAKKNMNIYDFLNKEYGIVASAESVLMNTGSKSITSAEYRRPVNAFALGEALGYIMADPYKQHAQAVTLTAAGESLARGYGELSASELKDKVVDGAKDAWKSFLVLLDKLIEVIKQFIRGLFDKEKKLGDVESKLKAMLNKKIADSGKLDSDRTLKIAFVNPGMFAYLPVVEGDLKPEKLAKELKDLVSAGITGDINGAISSINNMSVLNSIQKMGASLLTAKDMANNVRGDATLIAGFLTSVYGIASTFGNQLSRLNNSGVNSVRESSKRGYQDGNYYEKDTNGNMEFGEIEEISVDKYKEDWNTLIEFYMDNIKELKKTLKTKSKGDYNATDAGEIEGLLVDNMNRNKADGAFLEKLLIWYRKIIASLKGYKVNKKLEELIKVFARLRQSIIRNKDGDFSSKMAQLGRVAVNKYTIIITKIISTNNTVYATLFKAIAINLKSANAISTKRSRGRNDLNDTKRGTEYAV